MDAEYQTEEQDAASIFLGSQGDALIRNTLASAQEPKQAMDMLQRQLGTLNHVSATTIPPVFELTDLLGVARNKLYEGMMHHLVENFVQFVKKQEHVSTELLEQTFPYIGFAELRQIPVAILTKMNQIPEAFLRQLKDYAEIFETLPLSVKRQVWEIESELFRKEVFSLLTQYLSDPNVNKPSDVSELGHDPKKRRDQNEALKALLNDLGSSHKLYTAVLHFCHTLFVNTNKSAFCTFRFELLMSLHDHKMEEVYKTDPCHYFAWWLDAWLRAVDTAMIPQSLMVSPSLRAAKAVPTLEDAMMPDAGATANAEQVEILKRLRDVQHYFDGLDKGDPVWADIAMTVNTPMATNTIAKHILWLLEKITQQQSNKSLNYLLHHPPYVASAVIQEPDKKKKKTVIKINLGNNTKPAAKEDSQQDHMQYALHVLSRLFLAGQHVRAMLKKEAPNQLPELPEFYSQQFYPYVQSIIHSNQVIADNEDEIDAETSQTSANQLATMLKQNVLARKLLLLSVLKSLQKREGAKFAELFNFVLVKPEAQQQQQDDTTTPQDDKRSLGLLVIQEEQDFIYSLICECVRFYQGYFVERLLATKKNQSDEEENARALDATIRLSVMEQFFIPHVCKSTDVFLHTETSRLLREYANVAQRLGPALFPKKSKEEELAAAAVDAPQDEAPIDTNVGAKLVSKLVKQIVQSTQDKNLQRLYRHVGEGFKKKQQNKPAPVQVPQTPAAVSTPILTSPTKSLSPASAKHHTPLSAANDDYAPSEETAFIPATPQSNNS